MIITAKFKGVNSLGYDHGKEYVLKVSQNLGHSVKRIDGTGKVRYQSISSFLKNWDNIRVNSI